MAPIAEATIKVKADLAEFEADIEAVLGGLEERLERLASRLAEVREQARGE